MKKHLKSSLFDKSAPKESLMGDSEELMQLVLRTQDMGTWRYDVSSGKAYWSEHVAKIHGRKQKVHGMALDTAIRAFHPTDAKTVAWLIMHAIENRTGFSFVLRVVQPSNAVRLVHSAAEVELDASGNVVAIFGVLKDVTEQLTEKDVGESRRRLVRSIIAHSPAPLIVLDKHMHYLEVSPSWTEYYRLPPPRELIGRSHYEVMRTFRRNSARTMRARSPGRQSLASVLYARGQWHDDRPWRCHFSVAVGQ